MLNEGQQKVVEHQRGSIIVKAGPGSGKTKTIVERCIGLIASGVSPSDILLITFTNFATNEIQERVNKTFTSHGISIHTIHSLGYLILREQLGSQCPTLLGDHEAYQEFVEACMAVGYMPTEEMFLSAQVSKSKFMLHREGPAYYQSYIERLSEKNIMDLQDLVLLAALVLTSDNKVLEQWRNRWKYITVDEAHDCTPAEMILVHLLAKENLCVVMDEDQSIYGWRGGDPEFVKKCRPWQQHLLPISYRCPDNIYKVAKKIVGGPADVRCLRPTGEYRVVEGDDKAFLDCLSGDDDMILCRTEEDTEHVKYLLTSRGIPTNKKESVFDSHEADIILAYAKAAIGSEDTWETVAINPFREITREVRRAARRAIDKGNFLSFLDPWLSTHLNIDPEADERCSRILGLFTANTRAFVKSLEIRRRPKNAAKVMTIHASKGLESRSVILYNMSRGIMPHRREVDHGSERRVLYVGITRASERLIIHSVSGRRSQFIPG